MRYNWGLVVVQVAAEMHLQILLGLILLTWMFNVLTAKVVTKIKIEHPRAPDGPPAMHEEDTYKAHFVKKGKAL